MKSTALAFASAIVITAPLQALEPCGTCVDLSEPYCTALEMDSPCHSYQYNQQSGVNPRGGDMHLWGGYAELGWGNCGDEHAAPCIDHFGEEEVTALETAVVTQDVAAAKSLTHSTSAVWLEFNPKRGALQVLAQCTNDATPRVVAHVPVPDNERGFWRAALNSH